MTRVRQIAPKSTLTREDVLAVKAAMAVIPELLPLRLFRVLQVRGWLTTTEEPCRLRARGWAKIAQSDQAVHNRRSAAMLKALDRDPHEVASNARATRARWNAEHLPATWKDTLAEMLAQVAETGACARDRDAMPIEGKEFLTIRDCQNGLLVVHEADSNAIVGPTGADGVLNKSARIALRAWRLVPRGLVRAERVAVTDDTILIRLYPTESGAQVTDSALNLT